VSKSAKRFDDPGPAGAARSFAYVEDDARFRYHFATLLRQFDPQAPVATFSTAELFLREARIAADTEGASPWTMVFMDLGLPGIAGSDAIAEFKAIFPACPCLALTVFDEPQHILAAIRSGADGYLLKSMPPATLLRDIEQADRYGAGLSPVLAEAVLDLVRRAPYRESEAEAKGLTRRQVDVLRGLAEGETYLAIAGRLDLSIDTVRSHVRQIYAFLQVKSAREAVSKALRRNLI